MGKRTRVTLTDARIAKLKPTASNPQPKLWDARTPGLFVRAGRNGAVFAYEKMIGGPPIHHGTLGRCDEMTIDEARLEAGKLFEDLRAQSGVGRIKTLMEASKSYCIEQDLVQRSREDYEYNLNKYCSAIKDKPLNRVTQAQIVELWDSLIDKPGTRFSVFSQLRSVFNKYTPRYRLRNPILAVADSIGQGGKTDLIPEWQGPSGAKNWARCLLLARTYPNPHLSFFWQLLALTGMRPSEPKLLMWDDIDLEHGYMTIRAHKTEAHVGARIEPISRHVVELFAAQKRYAKGTHVLPAHRTSKKGIKHLQEHRGLHDWLNERIGYKTSPKMLRKFFVTAAENAGLADNAINYLVGHSKRGIKIHYSFRVADDRRTDLERVTQHLLTLVTSAQSEDVASAVTPGAQPADSVSV